MIKSGLVEVTPQVFAFVSRAAAAMISGVVLSESHALLVDPGVLPSEVDSLASFVERRGASVHAIFLTHHHWDHVLATARWPRAQRLAHPQLEAIVREEQRDPGYAPMLERAFKAHASAVLEGLELLPIDCTVTDDQEVGIGRLTARVLWLPGHAPDAAGLWIPSERVLFSSDLLDPNELPMPDHDLELYLRSLGRIEELVESEAVTRVVPGHGWPLASSEEILAELDGARDYLHRLAEVSRRCEFLAFEAAWPSFAALDYPGKGHPERDAEHEANARAVLTQRRRSCRVLP